MLVCLYRCQMFHKCPKNDCDWVQITSFTFSLFGRVCHCPLSAQQWIRGMRPLYSCSRGIVSGVFPSVTLYTAGMCQHVTVTSLLPLTDIVRGESNVKGLRCSFPYNSPLLWKGPAITVHRSHWLTWTHDSLLLLKIIHENVVHFTSLYLPGILSPNSNTKLIVMGVPLFWILE